MHGFSLAYIFGAGACLISLLLAFCSPHISKGAGSAFGPWPNNHEIDQIAIKMTGSHATTGCAADNLIVFPPRSCPRKMPLVAFRGFLAACFSLFFRLR